MEGHHRPRGPGLAAEVVIPGSRHFDEDHWSLYHLDEDFAEAVDLADEQPERLARLVERWWSEAGATRCCRWATTW